MKLFVTDWEIESVAVTEKVTLPALGGLPDRTPLEETVSQVGKEAAVHV